jgi:hypothetical protein
MLEGVKLTVDTSDNMQYSLAPVSADARFQLSAVYHGPEKNLKIKEINSS